MIDLETLSQETNLRKVWAKEDYLIGINFSRLLSITQGRYLAKQLNEEKRHY